MIPVAAHAEARLRGIVGRLLAARRGERNRLLFWASLRAGELVADGYLDARTATQALTDAADPRVHYRRRVVAAALGFLAGVGLLLAGVVVNVIWIAVAGFVVMLACTLWAVTSYRRMTGRATGTDKGPGGKRRAARVRRAGTPAGPGLMGRLEERWRRRQQGGR